MKENWFKIFATTIGAAVGIYIQKLAVPIIVLAAAMIADYITGLVSARVKNEINSRIGIIGIVKKACYMLVVVVGMAVDYLIYLLAENMNINIGITICFGLIVTVWLIVNELISILENLSEIGVPVPKFILKLVGKLKTTVEDTVKLDKESETEE